VGRAVFDINPIKEKLWLQIHLAQQGVVARVTLVFGWEFLFVP
jgi:hypothetical protein